MPRFAEVLYRQFLRHGYYALPRTLKPSVHSRFFYHQTYKILTHFVLPDFIAGWLRSYNRRTGPDCYLISFPKCGRTWLSLLIAKVLHCQYPQIPQRKLINLHDLYFYHHEIPFIWRTHDVWDENPERLRFGYGELDQKVNDRLSYYRESKILFLVRNPLDVFVSFYHNRRYRLRDYEKSLNDFVREFHEGIDNIILFYNLWGQLLEKLDRTHIVRYEELHKSPIETLCSVMKFLGISAGNQDLQEAVRFAEFENMRQMEKNDYFLTDTLQPKDEENENTYKTRKGEVQSRDEELSSRQREILRQRCRKKLHYFTYDLNE